MGSSQGLLRVGEGAFRDPNPICSDHLTATSALAVSRSALYTPVRDVKPSIFACNAKGAGNCSSPNTPAQGVSQLPHAHRQLHARRFWQLVWQLWIATAGCYKMVSHEFSCLFTLIAFYQRENL